MTPPVNDTGEPEFDVWNLPPTQALALEVLAARTRLGESGWTFSSRHRPALEALNGLGLIGWKHGTLPRTCLAWLTGDGCRAVLSATYKPPAITLLEEALFLRMNGERPPGHEDATWHDWDDRAERFLRGLLPPETEGPAS